MAAHAAWKGYLRLSLVSLPVRAYAASNAAKGEIHLNQLHETCKSRIRYKKTCPIHGEVSNDQIVMGYEYDKDQYVVVDTDEVNVLRSDAEKNIRIDGFVRADAIDPVYFSGRNYYLAPDGAVGQRPYNLIRESMAEEGLRAIAQAVISNREQLVMLWPIDKLIAMSVLEYKTQVKEPAGFRDEIADTQATDQEQKLARQLIEGVINLMDALRKSMQQVKPPKEGSRKTEAKAKPAERPKKQAPKKAARRKSG
jgi:DNA end-binding protein Ku